MGWPTGRSFGSVPWGLHGLDKVLPPNPARVISVRRGEQEPQDTLGLGQWIRLVVTGNETAEFPLYKIYKFIFL